MINCGTYGLNIVFFDTETTGLIKPELRKLSEQPFIIEYCFRKMKVMDNDLFEYDNCNSDSITMFKGMLKPPMPLPKVITKITGIRDSDLADAPKFIDIVDDLTEFFMNVDIMVAHNLPFDRSMLANELSRLGRILNFPWPPHHICTVDKTLRMKGYRLSLTKLYAELFDGKDFKAHRAEDDVRALIKCFNALLQKGIIKL